MKKVLQWSIPEELQVTLKSRHKNHIVKHDYVVPFLANPNTIDQLLIVRYAETQYFPTYRKDLIEAERKIVDLCCRVDRTEN